MINSKFTPDERNLGGKNQIFDHMYNHQISLLQMKPKVKSQVKNVEKIVVAKKILKKNPDEFNEVIESFKRATCVKGTNLSSCPETYQLKNNLLKKKDKAKDFIDKQHNLNLESQQRRINSIGTMNQRKKNSFDPIAKPVYFFRKPYTSHKDISITQYCSKLGFNMEENFENKENLPFDLSKNKSFNVEKNNKKDRKITKKHETLYYEEIKHKGNFRFNRITPNGFNKNASKPEFISAPTTKGNSEEDYSELKSKLIHLIVDNRIYKEEDLQDLLERTIILNQHLEKLKIEQIFTYIIEELEK